MGPLHSSPALIQTTYSLGRYALLNRMSCILWESNHFSLFLQLHHYIKQLNYINRFGDEIKFDDNGDPAAMYDLINWQLTPSGDMEFVTVGKFDKLVANGKKNLHMEEEKIVWNGNKSQVGVNKRKQ